MLSQKPAMDALSSLCEEFRKNNHIDPADYEKYQVKRGLRNADGSGVVAGLTSVCNVHGFVISEGERQPQEGQLIYRGISIEDFVEGARAENRFGFEEAIWLLFFGHLPTTAQIQAFTELLSHRRELPDSFNEDIIIKASSPNIMNKLQRSVLALYSYDPNPEDMSMENIIRQSIDLIAQIPTMMVNSYQVKRHNYDGETMFFHAHDPKHTTAEHILSSLRYDRKFTDAEAKLLDMCLTLHAEHGGGNNSTFAARVLSSSGTDTYSALSAAIGSLKGPKHGGANIKVMEMLGYIKAEVKDIHDRDEIAAFLGKLIRKEAGDRSGLIYGMGHAVYTLSDPRAKILRENARALTAEKNLEDDFALLEAVEELTPQVFFEEKSASKTVCANVDLYSGLVYKSLGIPEDLYTPIFAVARMAGWCAHRIEEVLSGGRIIRPAYKAVSGLREYVPTKSR
ncbi:MAG: citrate synthase [Oscillospiraceae bacterium]|jgi:citrate synthase|nr:citrate synthase [Oscillospiraceae bacterium]